MPTLQPSGGPSSIFDPADPVTMGCGIFKRLQIVTRPLGGSSIAWELTPGFSAPGPYHFYVDFGRSGTHGEWEVINSAPIIDECSFVDDSQRHWDHLVDFYYRIRLVLPNVVDIGTGLPTVYASQPHQANGLWSKKDWLLAREIARKEYLMQNKRTNMTSVGFIMKLRRWGQPCGACLEYDTEEVQSGGCATCFGTGFTGGYYKAVDFRITLDAPWQREFKRDETVSMTNNVTRKGRAVAYPYLDSGDIYIRRDSGERYFVNSISQIAEVGGIPIVIGVELKLAPVTDPIYLVPLIGGSSSSAAPASSSESLNGLQNDDDW